MDTSRLPLFQKTPPSRHSNLTTALILARSLEHQAERRLISERLKRIKIEQKLYSYMEELARQRAHKADSSIGMARRGFPSCGPFPVSEEAASDLVDSDLDSDVEVPS